MMNKKLLIILICLPFCKPVYSQIKSDSIKSALHEHPELYWGIGKKIRLIAQVGFRLEYMYNERFGENDATTDDDHRFRERVRLRFGAEFKPISWVTAGFRLSTGQATYPASGWSSFSDTFLRDPIAVDRVYINLNLKNFHFQMGAQENPLFHPTEMIWDNDVQPAGLAEIFQKNRLEITLGQYMLGEFRSLNNPETSGSFLFANGINYAFLKDHNLRIGLHQYVYNKPNIISIAIDEGNLDEDFKTNRLQPNDESKYFSHYNSIGISADYHWGKWRLVGDLATNISANQDATLGPAYTDKENFAGGFLLRYGLLQKPGDWSLEAGYFHIEADAVIAAFNSDDYQQTNVRSVPVWLRVLLPGDVFVVWDTYFQKRINTAHYLSGGIKHYENALKIRSRITLQLGF